ncbi:MAG: hypothetical protein AB7P03_29635 [Kofleriaceae bacterium]
MRYLPLVAVLALASPALADTVKGPDRMKADDCAYARKLNKLCVLELAAEDVEGTTPTSGDGMFSAGTFGRASSLIRIRREFIVEILRSAEDLD